MKCSSNERSRDKARKRKYQNVCMYYYTYIHTLREREVKPVDLKVGLQQSSMRGRKKFQYPMLPGVASDGSKVLTYVCMYVHTYGYPYLDLRCPNIS